MTGQLLGTISRISDLFGGSVPHESIYGPGGSRLYDSMLRSNLVEVGELLRVADGHHGPVLELACGNGRTTVHLLRQGFDVVGLDSSPDMLARLADRLREPEWQRYAGRLSTVEGDMRKFSLGRAFGLVMLGMGTVWMLDATDRASLFRSVRDHLTDQGRFLVTLPEIPGLDEATAPFEQMNTFVTDDGTGPVLCTSVEYLDPVEKIRLTSILAQRVAGGVVTQSTIYTDQTHLITPELLAKEMEQAGLRVIKQHYVGNRSIFNDSQRRRVLFEAGP